MEVQHNLGKRAPRFEETDDLENSKVCTVCKKRLPREAFHKRSTAKDGLQSRCRNCYRDWYNEQYHSNPGFRKKRREFHAAYYEATFEERAKYRQDIRVLSKYGLTREAFDELSDAQDGLCAICGRPPIGKKRLSVDHCHESGEIRGLLCDPCNTGLGMFGDDPARLQVAVEYLGRVSRGRGPATSGPAIHA